jgi:hypothetical protein
MMNENECPKHEIFHPLYKYQMKIKFEKYKHLQNLIQVLPNHT